MSWTPRSARWTLFGAIAVPFVVALGVLAGKHWTPVLDLAMTELRVRDVGGAHTPLIGLPGRIGNFPDQGSHPGPLSFYLLAPLYRLFGASAFGLFVATVAINLAAVWLALWLAGRRGGLRLVLAVGGMMMALSAWYGLTLLTQPWNPYLPLLAFAATLLACWATIDGDRPALVVLVVGATLCAQTHVPYLPLGVVLCAVGFIAVARRAWRSADERRSIARWAALAAGVGAVLWLPVFVDEAVHAPGNITMLRRHFSSPPEPAIGAAEGLRTMLAHFDPVEVVATVWRRPGSSVAALDGLSGGRWPVGLVVVVVWLVLAAASRRLVDRRPWRLHVVALAATAVGAVSAARIFGKNWFYLTLWGWVLLTVAMLASLWTVVAWHGERGVPLPVRSPRSITWGLAGLVLVLPWLALGREAVLAEPPEARLSSTLRAVVGPTVTALRNGDGAATGAGGQYVVRWHDAYFFGSQGYGLISELQRHGLHAGATETFRVPITAHRVIAPERVTAEVVLVTGSYLPEWRAKPGVVEVATTEPRSSAERAEFQRLHDDVVERLVAGGATDLVELVDLNLFGVSIDPRLDAATEREVARMLILGQETAVFIAPPGTFDGNG